MMTKVTGWDGKEYEYDEFVYDFYLDNLDKCTEDVAMKDPKTLNLYGAAENYWAFCNFLLFDTANLYLQRFYELFNKEKTNEKQS